jgi:hypothetical protein
MRDFLAERRFINFINPEITGDYPCELMLKILKTICPRVSRKKRPGFPA